MCDTGADPPFYIFTQGSLGPVPMTPEQMVGGLIAPVGPTYTFNGIPMDTHVVIHAPPSTYTIEEFTKQHYKCKDWITSQERDKVDTPI